MKYLFFFFFFLLVSKFESHFLFNVVYCFIIYAFPLIFFLFFKQVISVLLATLATVTCSIACVFSAIHLARLMGLECNPARVLNATCVCRPRGNASNFTELAVRYMDLNCPEVESILTILLIFSSTCNALGALVSGWYTYLHWSTRHKRPKYMQVRTTPISGNNFLSSRPIYNPNLNER